MFFIENVLRIMVKDQSRYVLAPDVSYAPEDGREVILFAPRMEFVGDNLISNIRSFDLSDTTSSSRTLLESLEGSIYHYGCIDIDIIPLEDGSWLLQGRQLIPSEGWSYYAPALLSAVTFTDVSGLNGCTAVCTRNIPAASFESNKAFKLDGSDGAYVPYTFGNPYLYHYGDRDCFAVKFNTSGLPSDQQLTVRLTNINGVYGHYAEAPALSSSMYDAWRDREFGYLIAPLFSADLPDDVYYIGIEGYLPQREEPVFTASFRPKDEPVRATATPTAQPHATSTPKPTPVPAQTPIPRPSTTPAIDRSKLLFEDDRLVVTLERCDNDIFYIFYDVRVAVKDPTRYVLSTDAALHAEDGREVILFSPRVDAVDGYLYGTISSFDVSDTNCSSARTLRSISSNFYQYDTFEHSMIPQPDGSILLQCVGNAQVMSSDSNGSGNNYILSALTFTDVTGTQGRTEVLYRTMPSASYSARSTDYKLGKHTSGFEQAGTVARYDFEGYSYLSVRFDLAGEIPFDTMVNLTSVNEVQGNYGVSGVTMYIETTYDGDTVNEYYHVLFRLDNPPDALNFFTIEGYAPNQDAPLFTAAFQASNLSVTSAPQVTPQPDADGIATGWPVEPDANLATYYSSLNVTQKVLKYSTYRANYRHYGDFGFVNLYFRYHDPLPETAVMRITAIDGVNGNFGEAPIALARMENTPSDLLVTSICSEGTSPAMRTLQADCIDAATGEVLFSTTLQPSGDGRQMRTIYNGPDLDPVTAGQLPAATPAPTATVPPTATPVPTLPPASVSYDYINLTPLQTPSHYVHHSATFRAYMGFNAVVVTFRSRNELPQGAFLRLTSRNGTTGNFGEAVLLPDAAAGVGFCTASIPTVGLGLHDLYTFGVACIDPATGKTLFEFRLQGREQYSIYDSDGHLIRPRPTQPPLPTIHHQPAAELASEPTATPTPTPPAPVATRTEPPQELATYYNSLTISQKDRKYSGYNAYFRLYGDMGFVTVNFRYHDPLPATAVMRIIAMDDQNGHFGEGTISPAAIANAPDGLLTSVIHTDSLTMMTKTMTIACVDTATGETIFTTSFRVDRNGRRLNDTFVDPEAPAAASLPTPAPVHTVSAAMAPDVDTTGMAVVYTCEEYTVYRATDWYDQIMADAHLVILPNRAGSALEISGLPRPDGHDATRISLTLDAVANRDAAEAWLPWRLRQLPLEQAPVNGGFVRELGYNCTYLEGGGVCIDLHECMLGYGESSFALCGTILTEKEPGSFAYTLRTDGTYRHVTVLAKSRSEYVDFEAIIVTATNHGHYISFMLAVDKGDDYAIIPTAFNSAATTITSLGVIRPDDQRVYAYWYEMPELTDVPNSVTFDVVEIRTGQVLETIRGVKKDYYWPFREY